MNYYVLGAFVGYLAIMLFIGFFFSNKTTNLGSYYLGGRKMNKWVVALSAQASDMSGWLLMGLPGAVFARGFSEAWIGIGLAVGTYLNWKIVAKRLRLYSRTCKDSITIPDFISNRFRDDTGIVRIVAALIILVFFTFYTASGFVSCAKLFMTTFPTIPLSQGQWMWFGALIVVSYTLMGGYMAVCWTDVIQGTLMFVGIVIVPFVVICESGGFSETVNHLNAENPYFLNLFTNAATGKSVGLIGLTSSLVWGLGYFGMPHILVRFMSIDKAKAITASRRIAMTWVAISLGAAVVIGLVGNNYLAQRGLSLAQVGGDPEKIFMVMINGVFHNGIIAGVFLSSILAAIMSTADSQLLVSASAFSSDFYKVTLHRKASDSELIIVSRLAVAAVAIIAGIMAWYSNSEFYKVVMSMVSFAWAGFGAAFGPVILLSLFWKRTNLAGAVAGMVVGAASTFIWKFGLPKWGFTGGVFDLYELAPGFALSFLAIIAVTLLTGKPSKEITDEFESVAHTVEE